MLFLPAKPAVAAMRKAFTLVEVGVVLAIFVALVVLLLPALQSAVETARRAAEVSKRKEEASVFVKEKWREAEIIFDRDSEENLRRREEWVQQQKDDWDQHFEEEKQRRIDDVRRLEEEARESWSKFWAWWRDLWQNALLAVLVLFVTLIAARAARPLSRALAAVVIRRMAPSPRQVAKLDEDA